VKYNQVFHTKTIKLYQNVLFYFQANKKIEYKNINKKERIEAREKWIRESKSYNKRRKILVKKRSEMSEKT